MKRHPLRLILDWRHHVIPGVGSGIFIGLFFSLFTAISAPHAFGAQAQTEKLWIYFHDKGPVAPDRMNKIVNASLSPRAVTRRHLRGNRDKITLSSDLPIHTDYINEIRALGVTILRKSKWLNAISITASPTEVAILQDLPFIDRIAPVRVFRREQTDASQALSKSTVPASTTGFDYGSSLDQIQISNISPLHEAGLTGEGVLIALLDTGFFTEQHRAYQHLDIVIERDFINDDDVTKNEAGDSISQHNHGSWVLSVVGGFSPGEIIGPAYGAQYALAKTENVASETRVEEDNWVAAAEWADSLGADIISTSLGYLDFDGGFTYTLEDLDGSTMVTSVAASMAVDRGIVVITSAGNEGNDKDWPYILSPADGHGVIAVGGVNRQGARVAFSSIGPTADQRIKPDVMAMAASCVVANFINDVGVAALNGTSFAAPLVAGVSALLLQAFPQITPEILLTLLTTTASNAETPDNFDGYGIVNGLAAFNHAQSMFVSSGELPSTFQLLSQQVNTETGTTRFIMDVPQAEVFRVTVYNVMGQQVEKFDRFVPAGRQNELLWNWPTSLSSGLYWAKFSSPHVEKVLKTMVVR